jgi:hypothetical protein
MTPRISQSSFTVIGHVTPPPRDPHEDEEEDEDENGDKKEDLSHQ